MCYDVEEMRIGSPHHGHLTALRVSHLGGSGTTFFFLFTVIGGSSLHNAVLLCSASLLACLTDHRSHKAT